MTDAGHAFWHFAHPTHLFRSTFAYKPLKTEIAFRGHVFSQQPQATHSLDTTATFFNKDISYLPPSIILLY